jgi:hypothetical protein
VPNGFPLGRPLFVPVHTVNDVQTLQALTTEASEAKKESFSYQYVIVAPSLCDVISVVAECMVRTSALVVLLHWQLVRLSHGMVGECGVIRETEFVVCLTAW